MSMFESYRNRMAARGKNVSEMLRMQSNMVIEHTWTRDPNYKQVYVVKVDSGLPEITAECELIDTKFNIKTYQSITSDEAAYMLQFRHGEEKRHPEIALGSYVYMEDEDHEWKWWLICHLDERPQFRQYQILECNWTFGWVTGGKIYHCLGVQRVQQSYSYDLYICEGIKNPFELLGIPERLADYNAVSNNERECLKIVSIGQSAAKICNNIS